MKQKHRGPWRTRVRMRHCMDWQEREEQEWRRRRGEGGRRGHSLVKSDSLRLVSEPR